MDHPLSGHLPAAVILIAATVVAMAARRAAGSTTNMALTPGVSAFGDMPEFIRRPAMGSATPSLALEIEADPLTSTPESASSTVAQGSNAPTVAPTAEQKLTAVLIADDRRVAVIDDAAVAVGDALRDGSRVSAIQPNGVWLVDRNGRWRVLTLSRTGGR